MITGLQVLLTLACLLVSTLLWAEPSKEYGVIVTLGQWRESQMGNYPKHENHPTIGIEFRLNTGKLEYGLRYHVCIDKSHAPDVATPEGYIGMFAPSMGNWYHNGFLYVSVNDRDIGLSRASAVRVPEQGERGMVDIIFPTPQGEARITFLALPGDERLMVRIGLAPAAQAEVKSLKVRTVCYPSGYIKDGDRWITTAERSVQQRHTIEIDPQKEWWIAYYDKVFDPARGKGEGSAAMLFLPEQIAKAKVEVGTYGIINTLEVAPGLNEVRLIFWDFKGLPNDKAISRIRSAAKRTQDDLRHISFANRNLNPAIWQKMFSEISDLAASLPDRAEQEKRIAALRQEIESLSNTIHAAISASRPPGASDEDKLLDNLKKLEELRWDLRFKALFVE